MRDDAEATGGFLGLAALANIVCTPEERHLQLARVTPADVREAAHRIFRPERLTVVAVGLLRASEEAKLERAVRCFGG